MKNSGMRRSPRATLALRGGALVFCMGGIALLIAQFRGGPAAPPSGAPTSDSAAENRSQARLPPADSTDDWRNPGRRRTDLAPSGSESRGMIQLVNVDVSLV